MIGKIQENSLIQICENCGDKREKFYTDLIITDGRYIKMPKCDRCNSVEIFFLNNADNDHGRKVSRLFANVNATK